MSVVQRQTPESDKAELDNGHFADWGYGPSGYCHIDFARALELDRNRLREALQLIANEGDRLQFSLWAQAVAKAALEAKK